MGSESSRFGRYTLLRRLGHGGMAEAWHARYTPAPGLSKDVVLKRILPHHADDSDFRAMFLSETKLTLKLSHGNVVQVFDAGEVEDQLFIAMEWVDGVSLDAVLQAAKKRGLPGLPPVLAVLVTIEALKGLHHAHTRTDERGRPLELVHRDVSPDNVLISYDGEVKVADFGIARARLAGREGTQPGFFKGKLWYAAPEQARAESVDGRADLYSTALVLYELICGQNPAADDLVAIGVASGVRELPRFPVELADPELVSIVTRALAPEPSDRHPNVLAFQQALSKWAAPRAGEHAASGLADMMRWLFPDALAARYPGRAAGPGLESWLALAQQHSERGQEAKRAPAPRTATGDEPTLNEKPPAFEAPRAEPERAGPSRALFVAAALGLAFAGAGLVWVFHEPPRREAPPAPPPKPPPQPPPLRVGQNEPGTEPISAPTPPPPAAPPLPTTLAGVPARFELSDTHRFAIDSAVRLEVGPSRTLTLWSAPELFEGNVGRKLTAFAATMDEGRLTLAPLALGTEARLPPAAREALVFAPVRGNPTDLPVLKPALISPAGRAEAQEVSERLLVFLAEGRRLSLSGLSPKMSHLIEVGTDAEAELAAPVVVISQGAGATPAKVAGLGHTVALTQGAHLVSGATALHFALPSLTGVKAERVRLEVVPIGPPGPPLESQTPAINLHLSKAQAELRNGRLEAAHKALARALKLGPGNTSALYYACLIAFAQGDGAQAAKDCGDFELFSSQTDPNRARVRRLRLQAEGR